MAGMHFAGGPSPSRHRRVAKEAVLYVFVTLILQDGKGQTSSARLNCDNPVGGQDALLNVRWAAFTLPRSSVGQRPFARCIVQQ